MIEETIRASGKFQVEIKSDYGLERDSKDTAYSIDTYAFVPGSLDVNSRSYPKYLFYRDTQTYIRFSMPIVLLRDIAAEDSTVRISAPKKDIPGQFLVQINTAESVPPIGLTPRLTRSDNLEIIAVQHLVCVMAFS